MFSIKPKFERFLYENMARNIFIISLWLTWILTDNFISKIRLSFNLLKVSLMAQHALIVLQNNCKIQACVHTILIILRLEYIQENSQKSKIGAVCNAQVWEKYFLWKPSKQIYPIANIYQLNYTPPLLTLLWEQCKAIRIKWRDWTGQYRPWLETER